MEKTEADLTLKSSSGVSKTINYYTEDHNCYNDRHDFTVNLDYAEDAVTSIKITFSAVGVYSIDSIEVICQPMDSYADGELATLYQANVKNMALVLHAGEHNVKLVYHTPYLRIGAGLSVAGFMGFLHCYFINIFRKRRLAAGTIPIDFRPEHHVSHEIFTPARRSGISEQPVGPANRVTADGGLSNTLW